MLLRFTIIKADVLSFTPHESGMQVIQKVDS
jgi:hypothetical protein